MILQTFSIPVGYHYKIINILDFSWNSTEISSLLVNILDFHEHDWQAQEVCSSSEVSEERKRERERERESVC